MNLSNIIFTSDTNYKFQHYSEIFDFLDTIDLIQFSNANSIIYNEAKKNLDQRKANKLINYFYDSDRNNISIRTKYDSNYKQNVKDIFMYLPQLFNFITKNDIKYIDLSCLTSYGGYPEAIENFTRYNIQIINEILDKLLVFIKNNKTLTGCNIGFFEYHINLNREKVENALKNHNLLEYISIHANGATSYFNEPPTTLYKKDNGDIIWSHFKPK